MRTKSFLLTLSCIVVSSLLLLILGPAAEHHNSFKDIVSKTHKQLREIQENLRVTDERKLTIDAKYLGLLGFTSPIYNGSKSNFSFVTYVQDGQAPLAILLSKNVAVRFPNEFLLIYDIGLTEDDSKSLSNYCNNSKCSVMTYDLSVYPPHVTDQRMHAFRPIVIKDALMRFRTILFVEIHVRYRGTSHDLHELLQKSSNGILGWTTRRAVSTRTHPKMFDYFKTHADDYLFMRMVDLDSIFFTNTKFVNQKIMLPWLKCSLTLECIDPIGAQPGGCKYNKKPQYRYSGCHAYDTSAFNIILGKAWHLEEAKYSLPGEQNTLFYKVAPMEVTKLMENKHRNFSEGSGNLLTDI